MELRHLRYFVAVAEAEHFGKAAAHLRVSPSPLSRQIRQLEEEIGTPLFASVGRGVRLTPAGRAFLEGARATLTRAALAVDDARATARGSIGTLVIGFEGGIAYTALLPKVMSSFRTTHPQVEVRLRSMESHEQAAALREHRISVGFQYAHGPAVDDPDVRSRVLFRDRLGVVLPKRHRLARRSTVRIADLKDERIFWASRAFSPTLNDALRSALLLHRESLVLHEENDGEALLTFVASGEGITFIAESAASFVRIGATFKPVRDLDIVTFGRVIWRATDESDPLVRSVLEITRALHERRSTSP